MKYLKYFLVASIVVFTSYTTGTSRLSESIYPGDLMPEFKLKNETGAELDLKHLKGQKILINFWATYEASSHKDNVLLYNTVNQKGYPITMVSVCFDNNKTVFDKTLEIDGVDRKNQFQETLGNASNLYQMYGFENGFTNYLIDEDGVVIATNVSPDDLKKFVEEKFI